MARRRCRRVRRRGRIVCSARGRSRRRGYRSKPAGMARRGSKCVARRRVRVRGQGYALRCVKYRRR